MSCRNPFPFVQVALFTEAEAAVNIGAIMINNRCIYIVKLALNIPSVLGPVVITGERQIYFIDS